jgi:hypothetical protein
MWAPTVDPPFVRFERYLLRACVAFTMFLANRDPPTDILDMITIQKWLAKPFLSIEKENR